MSYPSPILSLDFVNGGWHPALQLSRASAGTYWDSGGVLRSAGAGRRRLDCDPLTGICKGLLIESQTAFLGTYSDEIDNAANGLFGAIVTPNAAVAIDGTTTMDKLIESALSEEHRISKNHTSAPSQSHVLEIEVASAGDGRNVRLLLADANANTNSIYATFNPDTGAWASVPAGNGNASGVTGGFIPLPGGRFRVWIAGAPNNTGSTVLSRVNLTLSTAATYTGNGTSGVYLRRFLTYQGTLPVSNLPTTAAAVTRSADVCSLALPDLLDANGAPQWNGTEGTLLVDCTRQGLVASGRLLSLHGATSADMMVLTAGAGTAGQLRFDVVASSVSQAALSLVIDTAPIRHRVACAFGANDIAACIDGGSIVSDTSATIPTVTTMGIGIGISGNPQPGWYRQVLLFNRRLSNAQIQALTAA